MPTEKIDYRHHRRADYCLSSKFYRWLAFLSLTAGVFIAPKGSAQVANREATVISLEGLVEVTRAGAVRAAK